MDEPGFLIDRHAAVRTQMFILTAVGINFGCQHAGIFRGSLAFRRAENRCTGTVTEQNAGIAIRPVGNFRKRFGTDHQRGFNLSQPNHIIGDLGGIDKSGTSRVDIHCRRSGFQPQFLGQLGGGGRKSVVTGNGGNDDKINFFVTDSRVLNRHQSSIIRQITGCFTGSGNMAAANTGTGADPFVVGIHHLRQIIIRKHFGRKLISRAKQL